MGAHHDFRFFPSVNDAVWSRASDHVGCTGLEDEITPEMAAQDAREGAVSCDPEFTRKSPFCTRCYHAYSQRDKKWMRAIGDTDFVRPLSPTILQFPLAEKKYIRYGVGYFQTFGGWSGTDYRLDEISFWVNSDTPKSLMDEISNYSSTHHLILKVRPPSESGIYVHVMHVEGHPPEDFDFP